MQRQCRLASSPAPRVTRRRTWSFLFLKPSSSVRRAARSSGESRSAAAVTSSRTKTSAWGAPEGFVDGASATHCPMRAPAAPKVAASLVRARPATAAASEPGAAGPAAGADAAAAAFATGDGAALGAAAEAAGAVLGGDAAVAAPPSPNESTASRRSAAFCFSSIHRFLAMGSEGPSSSSWVAAAAASSAFFFSLAACKSGRAR